MNTTEDKMKKPDTRQNALDRLAALERECAGWMDASTRFQRERNASDAVLAEIEALLPPPEGDDDGLASRVRRVVVEGAAAHSVLDAMPCSTAPDCDRLVDRIKYATAAWLSERKEASHLAGLCDAAHRALDDAGLVRSGTPAERIGRLDAKLTSAVELTSAFGRVVDDIEALLPPPEGDDQGIVSRVRRLVTARAVSRQMLDEIEAALPPAYPNEFGLAQRVRGIVARSTPRTEPSLSPRDRAILAPLLAIIDAHLFDNDGARALAAVRAVVGVARG